MSDDFGQRMTDFEQMVDGIRQMSEVLNGLVRTLMAGGVDEGPGRKDERVSDLAEFLLARIAEDEAAARGAVRWSEGAAEWAGEGDDDWEHIARWDPTRVLAECEAKRRIVAEAVPGIAQLQSAVDGEWGPQGEDEPERLLQLLALPHAGHPDYREEWRP